MKQWYTSKTLWVNALGITAIILQSKTGYVLTPEVQVAILAIINMVLRAITGSEVSFGSKKFTIN